MPVPNGHTGGVRKKRYLLFILTINMDGKVDKAL